MQKYAGFAIRAITSWGDRTQGDILRRKEETVWRINTPSKGGRLERKNDWRDTENGEGEPYTE